MGRGADAEIQSTKSENCNPDQARAALRQKVVQERYSGCGDQPKASATRLEQSKNKPPAVNAKKPSDTRSWLRMGHLPLSFSMLGRND